MPTAAHGVDVWRNICKVADDLFKCIQFKIGIGNKIRL